MRKALHRLLCVPSLLPAIVEGGKASGMSKKATNTKCERGKRNFCTENEEIKMWKLFHSFFHHRRIKKLRNKFHGASRHFYGGFSHSHIGKVGGKFIELLAIKRKEILLTHFGRVNGAQWKKFLLRKKLFPHSDKQKKATPHRLLRWKPFLL